MKVVIYTQNNCQFTPQEKNYLASKGVTFEERNVETNKGYLDEMMKLGSNFAGTPVTQIVKDDGTSTVLKGFTQTEFDAALGGAPVAAANADMTMPQAPVDQPVVPPAPEPTPAPMPEPAPAPMPEPTPAPVVETPAPVEPAVQTANADMTMPQAPVDQPVVPPAPEPTPAPMPEPAPAPMPEPTPAPVVETPAPVEPAVQTANADMTMPQAPVDQPVVPPAPEPTPAPMPEPAPAPMPEPTPAPVVETPAPVEPAVQTANNPLDAILADLQQKVSAATPAVQTANADVTMPQAPVDQPIVPPAPEPTPAPMPEPTPAPAPAVDMPTPAADLPNVPDFPAK